METHWTTLERWKFMNIHCYSSKMDCTNKFYMPKLYENTPFNNSNVTHGGRINYQITLISWKIKETHWTTLKHKSWWTCIIAHQQQIAPLISTYQIVWKHFYNNTNVIHGGRNDYWVTLTFMKSQGNTLNNTEKMKVDEHALLLIKNRLHQ